MSLSSRKFAGAVASLAVATALGFAPPIASARPEYFARYRANPFARPELRTCAVCHQNPQGGGPRNAFGEAAFRTGIQFTPELRAKFPDRFLSDRANLGGGVEIVFEQGADGTLLVRRGSETFRVKPGAKDVERLDAAAASGPAAAAPSSPVDGGGGSPVFDYQFVNVRTGRVFDKGEFHFRFSHRFTSPIFNQRGRSFDLFGLDTFAYTGLGVGYGITNRIAVNAYRQVWDRKLEFSGDFSLFEQGESRSPISVMARAAIDGRNDLAAEGNNGHYTPSLQLVLSRSLFNRLALNVNPTFVFRTRGLDPNAIENHFIAIGLGGALKLRENLAIVGEFIPRATRNPLRNEGFHSEPTASFGLQFRTHRHVFEIVISNAWETNIAGSALGGPDEKHIGFNLFRRIK